MHRRALVAITLLGTILRIGYAIAIYEPSLVVYHGGEYALYRIGAEDILHGDLGFTSDLYLLRPPLFPLLMAALNLQPFAILAANILLSTSVILLTNIIARQLKLSPKIALLAMLIVALDPTSIKYASYLQAEPLANFLLACAFVSALKLGCAAKRNTIVAIGLTTGGLIVLSALARPAAYLLWIPLALWIYFARRRWRAIAAGTLVVAGFMGTGLWINHNVETYGHRNFSTIGNFTMLYYRAASVMHQATGQDIDDVLAELARRVEAGIGNDTVGVTAMRRHHHYTGSPELQNVMRDVAIAVFLEYPLYYIVTIPVGLYRVLIQVGGPLLLPGIAWNAALLLLACAGIWQQVTQRRWIDAIFLVLPCVYFLAGTLLVCTSCVDTRGRVMVTPLLAVMAAHGVMHLLNRRRAASASPSPPACS